MKTSAAHGKNLWLLIVCFVLSVHSAQAIQILFSFPGSAGNESSLGPDSQPAGISVGDVSRGSGLTAAAAAGAFSSSAWTTAASRDLNDYYTVTLTPQSGLLLTLTRLELDELRSATGITAWSIYSSLDSFSAALASFTVPDVTTARLDQGVNLGSSFANLSTPVEFRIYGFASEGSAGTWRIDNLEVTVSTAAAAAVPETGSSLAILMLAGAALTFARGLWSLQSPRSATISLRNRN